MVSRAPFQHEPLEQPASIRVVELSPAEEYNEEIICQLRIVDLDASPKYEAISYVWGSANDKADVLCDGKLLQIPQNLATALRNLRFGSSASSRVLWADSICIDQSNICEKSHQVGIMKRIFESASLVLIWLGWEESEHGLEVSKCMGLLGDMWCRLEEIKDLERLNDRFSIKTNCRMWLEHETGETYIPRAFIKFLEKPWFHRAWTFQEYILAKDCRFLYGRLGFPKLDVMRSILGGQELWTSSYISKAADSMLLSKGTPSGDYSLRMLLKRRRGRACTRAVDIVYSLLGVAKDASGIVPDYGKDFLQVFSEATLHIITQSNDLAVLGDGNTMPRSTSSELPSWLPDWHQFDNCTGVLSNDFERFSSAGDTVTRNTVSSDFRKLTLRGSEIDSVEYLIREVVARSLWEVKFLLPGLKGYDSKASANALRDILERFDSEPSDKKRTDHNLYELLITQYIDDINILTAVGNLWRFGRFTERFRIMVTRSGRLGVAPSNADLGDVVTICLGGRVPLLLRPTETKYEFLFVGQCYVDQMMNGQAMELHADRPMVDFVLV